MTCRGDQEFAGSPGEGSTGGRGLAGVLASMSAWLCWGGRRGDKCSAKEEWKVADGGRKGDMRADGRGRIRAPHTWARPDPRSKRPCGRC